MAGARSSCYTFGLEAGVPDSDAELKLLLTNIGNTINIQSKLPAWIGVAYSDYTNRYYMNLNSGKPYNGKFSFSDPANTPNRCVKIAWDSKYSTYSDFPETSCAPIYNYLCQDVSKKTVSKLNKKI